MSTKSDASAGGIGFAGLLCIAFIVLKLTGQIDWSWLWILAPVWIPFGIVIGILAVGTAITVIAHLVDRVFAKGS